MIIGSLGLTQIVYSNLDFSYQKTKPVHEPDFGNLVSGSILNDASILV